MEKIIIEIPWPVSINSAYRNNRTWTETDKTKGRVKTQKYKKWTKIADNYLLAAKARGQVKIPAINGQYELNISLNQKKRLDKYGNIRKNAPDASNYIKIVEDWLVSRNVTPDDRFCCKVTAEWKKFHQNSIDAIIILSEKHDCDGSIK